MARLKIRFKSILRMTALMSLLAGAFYYVAGTQAGLNLIWSGVEKMLPDKIHVGSLQGSLLSTLAVKDFSYQDETVNVTIHSMVVDADLLSLILHHVVIRDLQLDGLHVVVKASKNTSEAESAPFDTDSITALISDIQIYQATIHDAQINIAESDIHFSGKLNSTWQFEWSANIPDLSHVVQGVSGKLVTSGSINGARQQPEIQANISLDKFSAGYVAIKSLRGNLYTQVKKHLDNSGKLQVQGLSINHFLLPDFNLQTTGQFKKSKLTQRAEVIFSPVNKIDASIIFPALTKTDGVNQVFTANAKVDVKDFSQFKTLFIDVPQVRQWNGRVAGAFTGTGSLLHPVFDGGLQATQASVFIPSAAMRLSDINLVTRYHSGELVQLSGTLTAGSGTINLAGTYGIEDAALPLKLSLRGTDLLIKDTNEYTIKISPDLQLDYRNNDLMINGSIVIPAAVIQPRDFGGTATLPSDVVIVNQQTVDPSVPTNLSLRINLILGDRVKIKYRGLEAKLKGAVTIIGADGNPLTATGEFGIAKDGTYRAYGQSLIIQQGRIIYAGNLLTNPGISLRAAKNIKKVGFSGSSQLDADFKPVYAGADTLVVGVEASGTIDKPRITLFSDPAGLSQGDILSYLLLGYPQAQAKGTSSLALLNVVSDMYGNGEKKNVVNNLQETLGLDELSVGSTEYYDANNTDITAASTAHTTTTVNVGRNLGRNLSVHYSVGIFQQIQVFSLRYQINRHLALQTETSTLENGGDLVYQLESRD